MTQEWNAAANHQIPPGLWAELAAQKDKFESKRPMMPYTEEDVMNELRSITDKHEQPYVPTEVLQYLDQGQRPIDKAFKVLKKQDGQLPPNPTGGTPLYPDPNPKTCPTCEGTGIIQPNPLAAGPVQQSEPVSPSRYDDLNPLGN